MKRLALLPLLRVAGIALLALLAGCASVDPYRAPPIAQHLQAQDEAGDCARLLRALDQRIDALGLRDASAPRVAGFPYLRVDRFTAALGDRAVQQRAYAPWTELMARLDRQARAYELANAGDPALPASATIDGCRYLLATRDEAQLGLLRQAATVPDDYSSLKRALGLYPLTKLAFAAGVRRYQAQTEATFALPLAQLPTLGTRVAYVPAKSFDALPSAPQSAVFLPVVTRAMWRRWILQHAPQLWVDTEGPQDQVGTLQWQTGAAAPKLGVATAAPAATVRIAFTLIGERALPQVVYTFWFPRRPAQSAFDLLAGEFDALVWRVTLDERGDALVYDSMHACGCYHQFFPTARVRPRPQPDTGDETLFMPQQLPAVSSEQRVTLWVAARSHYLQRIVVVEDGPRGITVGPDRDGNDKVVTYALTDDDTLRALPLPHGPEAASRGVFDAAGLLPGSERAERWLFWPMGIASAGQMRQWGRHATAFVGRRHFDDPRLFDLYFERFEATPVEAQD